MYPIHTVESLQAYAQRLQADRAQCSTRGSRPRGAVRDLLRRVRGAA